VAPSRKRPEAATAGARAPKPAHPPQPAQAGTGGATGTERAPGSAIPERPAHRSRRTDRKFAPPPDGARNESSARTGSICRSRTPVPPAPGAARPRLRPAAGSRTGSGRGPRRFAEGRRGPRRQTETTLRETPPRLRHGIDRDDPAPTPAGIARPPQRPPGLTRAGGVVGREERRARLRRGPAERSRTGGDAASGAADRTEADQKGVPQCPSDISSVRRQPATAAAVPARPDEALAGPVNTPQAGSRSAVRATAGNAPRRARSPDGPILRTAPSITGRASGSWRAGR